MTVSNSKIQNYKKFTIASYPGGKSNVKKHYPMYQAILHPINYLVEPFAGLANFYFITASKYSVQKVWLNDFNPDIYALLTCIKDPDTLQELISWIGQLNPIERDDYYQWKQRAPKSLLDQAVRILIILNCSPNGAGGGYSVEKAHRNWYINKPKIWTRLSKLLQRARITNLNYKIVLDEIIENKHNPDIIYLDPPYFNVAEKGKLYGKHNSLNWKEFKAVIDQLTCPWLMSNRDCSEMRNLFNKYQQFAYNTYNDMNNTRNKNPELLISNSLLNY